MTASGASTCQQRLQVPRVPGEAGQQTRQWLSAVTAVEPANSVTVSASEREGDTQSMDNLTSRQKKQGTSPLKAWLADRQKHPPDAEYLEIDHLDALGVDLSPGFSVALLATFSNTSSKLRKRIKTDTVVLGQQRLEEVPMSLFWQRNLEIGELQSFESDEPPGVALVSHQMALDRFDYCLVSRVVGPSTRDMPPVHLVCHNTEYGDFSLTMMLRSAR